MWAPEPNHPLRRMFAGLTEQTFLEQLGVADPPVMDYLSQLLSRFINFENIYRLHDSTGKRLEEVVEMVVEAEELPEGATRREVHRHIGDFTLFWTGVYPESLRHLRKMLSRDQFVDYRAQGKRSYWIASTFEDEPYAEEAPILRRLSEEFELFAFGLNQVRKEWEKQKPPLPGVSEPRLLH